MRDETTSYNMSSPLIKTLNLDFGQIEIYEDYLIPTINEGVVIDKTILDQLDVIFKEYYTGRPFGYISNRKFDYSLNPIDFLDYAIHSNLVGIAIFCHKESSSRSVQFESNFLKYPMEPFFSREEAISWIYELIENYNKKAGL